MPVLPACGSFHLHFIFKSSHSCLPPGLVSSCSIAFTLFSAPAAESSTGTSEQPVVPFCPRRRLPQSGLLLIKAAARLVARDPCSAILESNAAEISKRIYVIDEPTSIRRATHSTAHLPGEINVSYFLTAFPCAAQPPLVPNSIGRPAEETTKKSIAPADLGNKKSRCTERPTEEQGILAGTHATYDRYDRES